MNVALLLAYDGTGFRGFARQPEPHRTVQGALERALSTLLRAPGRTVGAGRTDAGVHASGQVVSLAAPAGTDPGWLRERLNRMLGPEISVRAAVEAPPTFDARFSARSRTYEYRAYRDPAPDPFEDRFALHVPGPLDLRAMRAGARALLGEHDFSSFCRADARSPVRRLRRVSIAAPVPGRLVFRVSADSFCYQMVRSIVGTLLEIGRGKREASGIPQVLRARSRAMAGPVAAPKALHLVAVGYAPDPFRARMDAALGPLPPRARRPGRRRPG